MSAQSNYRGDQWDHQSSPPMGWRIASDDLDDGGLDGDEYEAAMAEDEGFDALHGAEEEEGLVEEKEEEAAGEGSMPPPRPADCDSVRALSEFRAPPGTLEVDTVAWGFIEYRSPNQPLRRPQHHHPSLRRRRPQFVATADRPLGQAPTPTLAEAASRARARGCLRAEARKSSLLRLSSWSPSAPTASPGLRCAPPVPLEPMPSGLDGDPLSDMDLSVSNATSRRPAEKFLLCGMYYSSRKWRKASRPSRT